VIAGVLRNREQKLLMRMHESAANLRATRGSAKEPAAQVDEKKILILRGWVSTAQSFLDTGVDFVETSL
jgi:cytochrome oxidase assembly protein ShyY1